VNHTKHMEFLWVRWLGLEPRYWSGPRYARLPIVGSVGGADELAFKFLDPSLVIRGCHLIPRFHSGRTSALTAYDGPTATRTPRPTKDWVNYYVNMFVPPPRTPIFSPSHYLHSFVDRNMFMRYHGGGVGHVDPTEVEEAENVEPEKVVENGQARLLNDSIGFDDQEAAEPSDEGDRVSDPGESSDEETANQY